ncbi:MAG: deoxyuridine 5'-triphosphate nucleotidohydrolase [Thermofilum sp. ex4484_15]|nr:MAG: deoxyuridine 5'-triphosphate nucleotidohydrolase [Thermofilum sp. ex4484_15]
MAVVPGDELVNYISLTSSAQVQPAGVDLTVDEIMTFESEGEIMEGIKLPKVREILIGEEVKLRPGAYKVRFREIVKVPPDCIGLAFPRSSLLRMGATINFAVWDPGYEGKGEALLVVFNPYGIKLKKGSRVAQMVFLKLYRKATKLYNGRYQRENLDKP